MISDKEYKLVQCNAEEQIKIVNNYADQKFNEIRKLTQNSEFKMTDIQIIIDNYNQMMHQVMGQCMGISKDEPVGSISHKIMLDMS